MVDVQNDFCPGGALAVPNGDAVIPAVNRLAAEFAHVVLTQDWHPPGHSSFASAHPGRQPFETIEASYGPQTLWPDHCVQGTPGRRVSPGARGTSRRADPAQGLSRGDQFLFGVSRKRPPHPDRARRLSARARLRARHPVRARDRLLRALFGARCPRGRFRGRACRECLPRHRPRRLARPRDAGDGRGRGDSRDDELGRADLPRIERRGRERRST